MRTYDLETHEKVNSRTTCKIAMIVFTEGGGITHYSYNLCEALSGMRNAKVELITSTGYGL